MERHHLGVTRNALRENRLVIFGLCSIGLRRHGPFISCHIFLPLCFALSGTHLGSSFLMLGFLDVICRVRTFRFPDCLVNPKVWLMIDICEACIADAPNVWDYLPTPTFLKVKNGRLNGLVTLPYMEHLSGCMRRFRQILKLTASKHPKK